jgi:hypothetical protein
MQSLRHRNPSLTWQRSVSPYFRVTLYLINEAVQVLSAVDCVQLN